jgi:hypothetical protein
MIRVAGVAEWEHEFEHQSDLYESRVWVPELGLRMEAGRFITHAPGGWGNAWMTQWIYETVTGCTAKVRLSAPSAPSQTPVPGATAAL